MDPIGRPRLWRTVLLLRLVVAFSWQASCEGPRRQRPPCHGRPTLPDHRAAPRRRPVLQWSHTASSDEQESAERPDRRGNAGDQQNVSTMRAQVTGVSLSPRGFVTILECATPANSQTPEGSSSDRRFLPLWVTNDARDARQATSPRALTLLQLLASVDMAGPVLPVETLTKLVVLQNEEPMMMMQQQQQQQQSPSQPTVHPLVDFLQESIRREVERVYAKGTDEIGSVRFSQQPDWIQARIALPPCVLDQVELQIGSSLGERHGSSSGSSPDTLTWILTVRAPSAGSSSPSLRLVLSDAVLRRVVWHEDQDETSWDSSADAAFISLALALRYKAPILVSTHSQDGPQHVSSLFRSREELQRDYPKYRSRTELADTPVRAHESIQRGYRVHQLEAALRAATRLGDAAAMQKIQKELDTLESMQELPVLEDQNLESME